MLHASQLLLLISLLVSFSHSTALGQKQPKKALKESDARNAIVAMQGVALKKGAVKVKDISIAGVTPVTVMADVKSAFRFEQVADEAGDVLSILKKKRWRAVEFRKGDRDWEKIDLLVASVGAERVERARITLEALVKAFETRQREQKGNEPLTQDGLTISQFSSLGSTGVAEIVIETSFQMAKDARGKWVVKEIGIGGEGPVDIATVIQSINGQKENQARDELRLIREALESFRRERGLYVASDSETVLMDHLSPRYIARIIRIDPWGRPYRYESTGQRFELRSDGADGLPNTSDDLTLGGG
jgi:hypothetical protein